MKQLTSGALASSELRKCHRIEGKQQVAFLISLRLCRKTANRIRFSPKNCILGEERQDSFGGFESYLPIIE